MEYVEDNTAIRTNAMLFDGFGIDFIWFGEFQLVKTKRAVRIDIEPIRFNLAFHKFNSFRLIQLNIFKSFSVTIEMIYLSYNISFQQLSNVLLSIEFLTQSRQMKNGIESITIFIILLILLTLLHNSHSISIAPFN